MKTLFPFIISTMFICITALPQETNTYSADLTNVEGIKKNVLFHSPSLEDNLLNDSPDRVLSIYLPSGYDENTDLRYPVVYMLHGFTQDQNIWYGNGSVMPLDVKSILDSLINRNAIAPMIIVSGNARNAYYGSFYTNSYVTGNWEDFIVNDLVAYIDSNYRTLAVCESRGIGGHSMGGYGTIKLAMKHPDIFGAAYSLSGACLVFEDVILGTMKEWLIQAAGSSSLIGLPWQALTMVAQAAAYSPDSTALPFYGQFPVTAEGVVIDSIWQKWLLNDPYTMIPIYRDSLLKLKALQLDCGTSDYLLYDANVHFSQTLTDQGIEHHFLS